MNRLYNPLIPFCINSSARPFASTLVEADGGDANSLNVVSVSDCEAEVCILSRACESCSLSTWDDAKMEARDPRREDIPIASADGLASTVALLELIDDMMADE